MKLNYVSGRMTVEGRTFELSFWNDSYLELPYFKVEEIVTKESRSLFTLFRPVKNEERIRVVAGWTGENRMEATKHWIAKYLAEEKERNEESRQIKAFCENQSGE